MPVAITSRTNPRVKQLRAAFSASARGNLNARLSGGLIAIEGEHLLIEALRAGLAFKTIFLAESRTAPPWLPHAIELLRLSDEVFASIVDTQSPQGIAALLVPPTWTLEDASPANTTPLLLIAAGLQDPGNLGTLIRSAQAFGATAVLTTPGTVSQWNQKALRASAGSVFCVPVISTTPADLTSLKLHLFAAVADNEPNSSNIIPTSAANLTQPCALLIGNEGAGLSAELLALAHTRITIPTPGRVESLNAAIAGSLLLYEASRQRAASSTDNLQPATGNSV
jgi:RNA methyltransferase, TrmH family